MRENGLPPEQDREEKLSGEEKESSLQEVLIVPPGLISKVIQFESHYNEAKKTREPIMILGSSGVGKTLFLHLFEVLFREDKKSNAIIRTVNCSHFSGDPNMTQSRFFGLVKGAFPGADSGIEGLFASLDGGAVFLEDIGELPLETQAILLTFIETGEFYKVGKNIPEKKVNVQIVGTTKRAKEDMCEDVLHRFFPFHVPPLCERREDVLFYLHEAFPDLVSSLTPWEVLSLLAYNWPGNVREVLRVGHLLERRENLTKYLPFGNVGSGTVSDPERIFTLDEKDTGLDASKIPSLYQELEESGVNVDLLETILNRYRVGINYNNFENKPFADLKTSKIETEQRWNERFSTPLRAFSTKAAFPPFNEAFRGYGLFCSLFLQDMNANKNALDVWEGSSTEFFFPIECLPEELQREVSSLMKSILEHLSGISFLESAEVPIDYLERTKYFADLFNVHPSNLFLSNIMRSLLLQNDKELFDSFFDLLSKEPTKLECPDSLQKTEEDGNINDVEPSKKPLAKPIYFRATPPFRLFIESQRMVDLNRETIWFHDKFELRLHLILTKLFTKVAEDGNLFLRFLPKIAVARFWSDDHSLEDKEEIDRQVDNFCRYAERFFKKYGVHWTSIFRRRRRIGIQLGKDWHSSSPIIYGKQQRMPLTSPKRRDGKWVQTSKSSDE
jgi:transcriptional regulator with AAA-type ATPase domain